MAINFQPEGYQTVIPYLIINDPQATIEFAQNVFGAVLTEKPMKDEGGKIMHAQIKIGDSVVMMGSASEHFPALTTMLYVYVPDCDEAYRRALDAGATSAMEPADQFYGDRNAGVVDSNGVSWWISTAVKKVSEEEMERLGAEYANKKTEGYS